MENIAKWWFFFSSFQLITFYTLHSVWLIGIMAHVIEYFNHSYSSFALHGSQRNFSLARSDTASAGQPKMKERSPGLPLQYIHSISLQVQPDRWVSPVSSCHPYKLMVLHWMAEPVFPTNKLLAKVGLLILCSFLRLIIHSTASSCYRCPALHPRSSHRRLTLEKKKNTSDGHLPRGKEEALWPFPALQPHLPYTTSVTSYYAKDSDVKMQTDKRGD